MFAVFVIITYALLPVKRNVKTQYVLFSAMVWKRKNVLVHFYQLRQTADAFMHNFEWLYLNHGCEYHIFTFASRFCPFFCTLWHKNCIKCISVFTSMHFYHSADVMNAILWHNI